MFPVPITLLAFGLGVPLNVECKAIIGFVFQECPRVGVFHALYLASACSQRAPLKVPNGEGGWKVQHAHQQASILRLGKLLRARKVSS